MHRNPSRSSTEMASDLSDDSDGLVTTIVRLKARRGDPKAKNEYMMTGGLGEGDVKSAHREHITLMMEKRRLEEEQDRLEEQRYRNNRRPARTLKRPQSTQESLQLLKQLQDRKNKGSIQKQAGPAVVSQDDDEDVLAPSSNPADAGVVKAAQPTKNTVQAEEALRAMKKGLQKSSGIKRRNTILDMEGDNDADELNDLQPENESTPYNAGKGRTGTQHSPASSESVRTSSSKKRRLSPPEEHSEIQVPHSQSAPAPSPDARTIQQPQPTSSPLSSAHSDDPALPLPQSHTVGDITPPVYSDSICAPPVSSSPPQTPSNSTANSASTPPSKSKKRRQRRKEAKAREAAMLSALKKKQQSKQLTTEKLQSFLPARRTKTRNRNGANAFDIPSSSDAEHETTTVRKDDDDDELSYLPTRKIAHKHRGKTVLATTNATPITKTAKAKKVQKAKNAKATAQSAAKDNQPRTYGRRHVSSEKENENENSTSPLSSLPPSSPPEIEIARGTKKKTGFEGIKNPSRELLRVKAKFEDVDQYALAFEENSRSSSSLGWR